MIKVVREKFKTDLGRELFDRISQISDDQEFLLNVFIDLKQDFRKAKMKMLLDAGLCEPDLIEVFASIIHLDIILDDELLSLLGKTFKELDDYYADVLCERVRARWRAQRLREQQNDD